MPQCWAGPWSWNRRVLWIRITQWVACLASKYTPGQRKRINTKIRKWCTDLTAILLPSDHNYPLVGSSEDVMARKLNTLPLHHIVGSATVNGHYVHFGDSHCWHWHQTQRAWNDRYRILLALALVMKRWALALDNFATPLVQRSGSTICSTTSWLN